MLSSNFRTVNDILLIKCTFYKLTLTYVMTNKTSLTISKGVNHILKLKEDKQ